jgi:sensor histidine kinase YesM
MDLELSSGSPARRPTRLPSWRVWAAGAIVLLLSQTLTIAQGYLRGDLSGPVTGSWVLHDLIFWFSWFAVSPLVFLVAGRYPLDRPTPGRIAAHLIAFPLVLSLAAVLRLLVRWPFWGLPLTFARSFLLAISSSMMVFLLLYTATVILFYALEYYHAYHSRELRASQLETMVVRAELDALRNQLQPHFLFNTLHAISALMSRDVGAARTMMTRFSDVLRLALDEPEQHEVRLEQELRFLDQYLDLQRMRFGDRLEVDLDVAPSTLECVVPRLILQPVVENALTHGIGSRAGAGRLRIGAELDAGALRLEIEDDGPGLSSNRGELLHEGVGLRNTRARLMHLYGEDAGLDLIDVETGGLCVTITIPTQLPRSHAERPAAIPA